MDRKRTLINLFSNIISFIVTSLISFLLTPYIVNSLGEEAYGFIGLANNFVMYASLITIALNSMSGRFISIKIYESKVEEANNYFNSVIISNIIIIVFLVIPSYFIIQNIDKVLSIPTDLIVDVKITFILVFINFIVGILNSIFSIATFVRNRMDLYSLRNIESNVLRTMVLIILFTIYKPRICYISLSALISSIYLIIFNLYYTKKLMPEIKIDVKYFDKKCIRELISSGIWNTITKLSQILLDGLDLLIANIFIGPSAMGILSIAKVFPTFISTLIGSIANVFMPQFTILYAEKKYIKLIKSIQDSMKILSIVTIIPIVFLIVYGDIFYKLWISTEDAKLIQVLSIITILVSIISAPINSIYNIFTVTNRLKVNSIVLLCTGICSTVIVFLFLKLTNIGIFAIVGVSTIFGLVRNIIFTPIYGAKCLNINKKSFYPIILKNIIAIIIVCIINSIYKAISYKLNWIYLIKSGIICTITSLIISIFLVCDKNDRKIVKKILNNIKRRILGEENINCM